MRTTIESYFFLNMLNDEKVGTFELNTIQFKKKDLLYEIINT